MRRRDSVMNGGIADPPDDRFPSPDEAAISLVERSDRDGGSIASILHTSDGFEKTRPAPISSRAKYKII